MKKFIIIIFAIFCVVTIASAGDWYEGATITLLGHNPDARMTFFETAEGRFYILPFGSYEEPRERVALLTSAFNNGQKISFWARTTSAETIYTKGAVPVNGHLVTVIFIEK